MTTETLGAPPPDPTAAPIVPPVATEKPRVPADQLPPDALSARLEQAKESARKALLAELGVGDLDAAKTAVAASRAAAEAAKSDAQKLAEAQATVTRQTEALSVAVAQAQAKLSDEQRAAVTAIAGQDPALWLKTYGALAPTWSAQPAPVVTTTAMGAPAPVAAPLPAPATTAPIGAPPAPSSTSPVNHRATYEALAQTNPFAAAGYLQKYPEAAKRT